MGTSQSLADVADIAEAQHGLITTRLAERRGVHRRDLSRMAASGVLEHLAHGVYKVAGAPRPRLEELRAAWLQLAPACTIDERIADDGVVSHESACQVYEVGQLNPTRIEFTVRYPRRLRSRRTDVIIYRARLGDEDVEWFDGLLVTSPSRTIADLCDVRTDGEHLAHVVADLLSKNLVDARALTPVLAPFAAAYGHPTGDGKAFLAHLLDIGGGYGARRRFRRGGHISV